MRSMILVRLAVVAVPVTVLALLAGSAGAVLPKTLYGKPGKVQILPAEGAGVRVSAGQKPTIKVPAHTIRRSVLKARDSQKICSTFKVSIPATAPATGWVVTATGGPFCGWVKPGRYQKIGDWIWQGEYAKEYHVQYDLTWGTKKKKKLAAVTYDLNAETDYKCTTLNCVVSADADKVPYLTFFG